MITLERPRVGIFRLLLLTWIRPLTDMDTTVDTHTVGETAVRGCCRGNCRGGFAVANRGLPRLANAVATACRGLPCLVTAVASHENVKQ